ncbi:type III secretion system export apparatus subunit SctV [Erwiniaceae bacterium BAC15a-03b]|uniref:Type III secretion system export apparatus subunit SctV n=1 Tax=Winslowiella arboricola TaxID=2978220 RepID=A0A9J6PUH9_9GAMM|nr:type III secretion system export apparatus subunit SctV [Winslowiella arboricola]MCU5773673.1 type III secretion system export apparatus subunit SctV [Winslowiella arboricola]MCU5778428.1 type III secretion system export apparatus subunit SctV [Winslowiella arboricola]
MNTLFLILNKIAISAMQRSEVVGAAFAMALVFMLIIPLPLGLIDMLIALNICLSSLLVVLAMYLPKPLAFSTFPAVLLLTTMFRLALSISTTRQILIQQDAGHVVAAFGNFVVGGNLAVGMVMFLILTVVNFLVITKGSERVAEVAARFTLDAMPGKQMSIDSDLRAGMIDVWQAKARRSDLAKESQLFGAMDGAMKFVKGDAIACLVILFINLIGGFSIGVLQLGMPAGEAMHVYSILTIGDGLIAQIPALLISLTAGMIITRVSSDNEKTIDNNIGREIAEQLTSQPKAWILSSIGMVGFALLPGMPTAVFLVLAALTMISGTFQLWRVRQEGRMAQPQMENEVIPPELNGKEDLRQFNPTRPYLINFPAASRGQPEMLELVQDIRRLRNRIVYHFGFTLPAFDIEFLEHQDQHEFRFSVYEIPQVVGTFNLPMLAVHRRWLAEMSEADREQVIAGDELKREGDLIWLPPEHPLLQNDEVDRWSPRELLVKRMENAIHASSPHFIGLQETRALMGWLETEQPELSQELQRVMPIARFSSVLQKLVAERIPLRSVRAIAEALIEHGQHERDINLLTDQVRITLKNHLCYQYAQADGLHVWLLTPELEEQLRDALRQTQNEIFFALMQEQITAILTEVGQAFPSDSNQSAVLLVAQDLRSPMRTLIHEEYHQVPVLSFAELQPNLAVNVLGRIDLDPAVYSLTSWES